MEGFSFGRRANLQRGVAFHHSEIKACGEEKVKREGETGIQKHHLKKLQTLEVSKHLVIQPPHTTR